MNMMRPSAPSDAWYVQPSSIDRWFCGVFEGGGAKGIAYTGALLELRELRGWFGAVAGASVGAITATLVAAGLTPEEVGAETDCALKCVRTGPWKGIGRLRESGGFFPSDALTEWLDQLLLARVGRAASPNPRNRVTFGELHERTGIELNVVAADLSLGRQIVFSHHQTPACSVADAVAASSAIPFAFESRLLAVREPRAPGGFAHHTIADGGVWSNFPMFVFEDTAFRQLYCRTPREIDPALIVGFLLDESQAPPVARSEDKELQFNSQRADQVVYAHEWLAPAAPQDAPPVPIGSHIATWILWPFALLGRAVELNGRVERGRWPEPGTPLLRNLLHALNGLLSGVYPWAFGALAVFVVALGAWQMVTFFAQEALRVPSSIGWTVELWFSKLFAVVVGLIVFICVTLATLAATLGVVANSILLRASRRVVYGLTSTYVNGPGAPEWATLRANVVALPIPLGVGALSFDLTPERRRQVIEDAREATRRKMKAPIVGAAGAGDLAGA